MAPYVVILGSLDTKGTEVAFLRRCVEEEGGYPFVVDTGVLAEATVPADVGREDVAAAAGTTIAALIAAGDKSAALEQMATGATHIVLSLLRQGHLGGVLSLGGSRGTGLSTRVMQALPVGVPKLMISTMASGQNRFDPYVGTKDVTLMHSVADVQGINPVTRPIFRNAAAAITAMSRTGHPLQPGTVPAYGASMLGASTALLGQIEELLDPDAEQLVAFHATGTGGRALEELIEQGIFQGVFEVTPAEVLQQLVGSPFTAGAERMLAAAQAGLPQVVAPGGLDFIIAAGPPESLPARYRARKLMAHTPTITIVRTSAEEMAAVARLIAERLAAATGPAAFILPTHAYSCFALPGQPLHDPESDRAFATVLEKHLPPAVELVKLETDLNDPLVARTAVDLMRALC